MTTIHKIGVLSDTHLNNLTPELLEICENHFKDCSKIFHAGDVTNPLVLEELNAHGWEVLAVRGNMDLHPGLAHIPRKRVVKLGDVSVGMCHGWGGPGSIKERVLGEFQSSPPSIILYGHTHNADDSTYGGVRFLNPGSPTDKRRAPFASAARLLVQGKDVNFELIRL